MKQILQEINIAKSMYENKTNFVASSLKFNRFQEEMQFNINDQHLNSMTERDAIEGLLDADDYQYGKVFKNPQTDFMNLTKNIRINTHRAGGFRKSPEVFVHQKLPEKIMPKRKTSQKKLMPIFMSKQYNKQTASNSHLQKILGTIFSDTKSNLLTRKQQILPPILDIDNSNNYSALKKKKSSARPYNGVRSFSTIQSQLSLFPSLQKQIKKRRVVGYI